MQVRQPCLQRPAANDQTRPDSGGETFVREKSKKANLYGIPAGHLRIPNVSGSWVAAPTSCAAPSIFLSLPHLQSPHVCISSETTRLAPRRCPTSMLQESQKVKKYPGIDRWRQKSIPQAKGTGNDTIIRCCVPAQAGRGDETGKQGCASRWAGNEM